MFTISSKFKTAIVLFLLFVLSGFGYLMLSDLKRPTLSIDPPLTAHIGPRNELVLHASDVSGIREIIITVQRGKQEIQYIQKKYADMPQNTSFAFTLEDAKLPDGEFTLQINVIDGSMANFNSGNMTTFTHDMQIDNKAPRIAVKTIPPNMRRGGVSLIIYEVTEPVAKTGIYVGDQFFKGYEQKENVYASIFPYTHDIAPADYLPRIMAQDLAGNVTESRLVVNIRNTSFKKDTLNISPDFLKSKEKELALLSPDKTGSLDQYIDANTVERDKNLQKLLEIGQNSIAKPQWEGAFETLPRSVAKATFGDKRTYVHDGKTIDNQIHLGLDLASVAEAEVPAANNGMVVFSEPLGIYGNLIVIDHGVGLFTIYSHLTDMYVKVGDTVKKSDSIGTTGTTGLAGGDHVHFGVLVGGVAVQPKEWMDPKWVHNHITYRFQRNKL